MKKLYLTESYGSCIFFRKIFLTSNEKIKVDNKTNKNRVGDLGKIYNKKCHMYIR